MKKFKRLAALVLTIVFVFVLAAPRSYADPMSLSQLASLSYGIGQVSGINFIFDNASPGQVNTQMQNAINNWLGGKTIIEKFGSEAARVIAGKLILPATLYNGIREFLNNFVSENDLETGEKQVFNGFVDGEPIGDIITEYGYSREGISATLTFRGGGVPVTDNTGFDFTIYFDGTSVGGANMSFGRSYYTDFHGYSLGIRDGFLSYTIVYSIDYGNTGNRSYKTYTDKTQVSMTAESTGTANIDSGYTPTVLNPDKEWSGTIGGYDTPDTNLEQILGGIDEGIAQGDLVIDGEIVDPVVPPTPIPTIEPGDIDGYWNRQAGQMEGLGQDINDLSQGLDSIGEQVSSQSQTLDNIRTETQAQTQAVEGVQESVSSIEGKLEDALATPDSEDLPSFKFDLRELFPFCIPFDIYRLLSSFDAEPQAPHVQLPIVIESINFRYNLDLDFSAWDPVAQVMRTAELIVYAIALAWATGKVIKW